MAKNTHRSRTKPTVFMEACSDSQPSPSNCTTDGAFLFLHIICTLTLGAAAPSHLSRLLSDITVTLSIVPLFFSWLLLWSLADQGTEDATLGQMSFNLRHKCTSKRKEACANKHYFAPFYFLFLITEKQNAHVCTFITVSWYTVAESGSPLQHK